MTSKYLSIVIYFYLIIQIYSAAISELEPPKTPTDEIPGNVSNNKNKLENNRLARFFDCCCDDYHDHYQPPPPPPIYIALPPAFPAQNPGLPPVTNPGTIPGFPPGTIIIRPGQTINVPGLLGKSANQHQSSEIYAMDLDDPSIDNTLLGYDDYQHQVNHEHYKVMNNNQDNEDDDINQDYTDYEIQLMQKLHELEERLKELNNGVLPSLNYNY